MSLETLADGSHVAVIPAGTLHLRMTREDLPLAEALDFAARHNLKRRFLFVSRLLGRHLPTPPERLRAAAARLADRLSGLAQPCLFIGMAETATALGQAVYRAWTLAGGRGLYVDTTRRRTGGEIAFSFTESHSHAPGHVVHLPAPADDPEDIFHRAKTLVIVDDEATTGRTAAQLAAAYAELRGAPVPAHLAVLVHWLAPGDDLTLTPALNLNPQPSDEGLRVGARVRLRSDDRLETHALLEGSFEFSPAPDFTPQPAADAQPEIPVIAPRGTRHGIAAPQKSDWSDQSDQSDSVLVIGTGELGFLPLLLAEQIEAAGGRSFLQCTTRSPVALGGAIGHIRAFPAITGEGYPEFLYNVPDDHPYDRVILCCEDPVPPPDHPIFAVPRLECRTLP